MAFVPTKQIPDDEQNKFASDEPTTPNPTPPPQSGGSVGVGGQASGQAKGTPPGVGSSTQFGSNAAKLSDYLAVNQPKIEGFGNKIAGNLSQGYNQTMGNLGQGFGNFNSQVQQGQPQADSNFISQAAANPAEFAKNPENVSKFQQAYKGNYTGPSNIESTEPYQNLNNEVNTAVQDAGLVGSPAGLGAYLNSKMGGQNQQTPGMQALDTALLQGSPNAQQSIRAAAQPYQGLQNYLSGQTQQANTNATNAKNAVAQNAAKYQGQFTGQGGVIPTFQNDLTARLGAASTSASTAANTAKADLLAGKVTPDDLKLLGINQGQLDDLQASMRGITADNGQSFDLSNYATLQDPSAVFSNPNTIATPEDYQRAGALAQLTGTGVSSLDQSLAGNAGKQNNSLLGFNQVDASTDVGSKLKSADEALSKSANWFVKAPGGASNQEFNQAITDLVTGARPPTSAELQNGRIKPKDFLNILRARGRLGQFAGIDPNVFKAPAQ